MEYEDFLESKRVVVDPVGFDIEEQGTATNPMLFDWQSDIVRWALRRGRSAIFADCGLGKTPMQLEWARHIPGPVLILAPLAVSQQTVHEGEKFGVDVKRSADGTPAGDITITNYERLHLFDPTDYEGIILDESSILKAFNGQMRSQITEFASSIKYRLCCSATPAPNDLIELTNHAEFLNVMSGKEIIALFFKQDGNTTHQWRLKGHAREAFWKWMAQWSVAVRRPSDLGYDDGAFILPELRMHSHVVEGKASDGDLFAMEAQTLQERRSARSASLEDRVQLCADMVNGSDDQWLVWCNLNNESEALTAAIPDAVEIQGKHTPEYKESAMMRFSAGEIRVLVTKPTIAGFGMNWQQCHKTAFVGLSDSYEQFYQAVRRCWRFGQVNQVDCHIITADTEGAVVSNIRRKEKQAQDMFDNIVKHMAVHSAVHCQQRRDTMEYKKDEATGDGWTLKLGDSCERIEEIPDDSVGLSVFSPPFPGMYAYTNSERDMGNVSSILELMDHFEYLMPKILRITQPGRLAE